MEKSSGRVVLAGLFMTSFLVGTENYGLAVLVAMSMLFWQLGKKS